MKVGVYYAPNDVRIENAATPDTPEDGLLVAVRSCGLCGTDVAKYRHRLVTPPIVLGHEVAGEVVSVGRRVTKWKRGDRVIVPHHIPCFECAYCRHENFSACPDFRVNRIKPGGFAELISVDGRSTELGVLAVPQGLSYDQAALCESLACCLRALKRSGMRQGDSVAIMGCGPVGLMNMILAAALGAGTTIALDVAPERLSAAKRLGAGIILNPREPRAVEMLQRGTGGLGADIVLVCVGSAAAIESGAAFARRGGQLHVFAECPPGSRLSLDPNLVYHELSIMGTYSSSPAELREALQLIESGRVNLDPLVTHRLPLESLQEAFDLAVAGKEALKILIHPGEGGS